MLARSEAAGRRVRGRQLVLARVLPQWKVQGEGPVRAPVSRVGLLCARAYASLPGGGSVYGVDAVQKSAGSGGRANGTR